MTLCRCYL